LNCYLQDQIGMMGVFTHEHLGGTTKATAIL
jgi:hypothetical protein